MSWDAALLHGEYESCMFAAPWFAVHASCVPKFRLACRHDVWSSLPAATCRENAAKPRPLRETLPPLPLIHPRRRLAARPHACALCPVASLSAPATCETHGILAYPAHACAGG